jgi:uncharacterized membrane protein
MKKILFSCIFLLFCSLILVGNSILAEGNESGDLLVDEVQEAIVTNIIQQEEIVLPGETGKQQYQKLQMKVTRGTFQGKTIIVENGNIPISSLQQYKVGDKLVVNYSKDLDGNDLFFITDYVRRDSLLWLFILFVIVIIAVGKWYGVTSLIGMGLSFFVIFQFILPQILKGSEPVTIAILGAIMIVPVTFYISHGLNKKATVSVIGTVIALILTGVLASLFINLGKLTGFSSEEANFIQVFYQGAVNIKGLLLAGIIISGIGVFDDITVSQAAIVDQLKKTSGKMNFKQLFNGAMAVGHDHIASVVNTLVLVYAGAALPLLILFVGNSRSFAEVVNYEFIAEEIIKTLVASIGLVLAVPITTLLAAWAYRKEA